MIPDGGDPFFGEIQDVYDEIGEGMPAGWESYTPQTLPDSRAEIEASGLFTDVTVRRFDWEISYTARDYIRLLETFSGHIAMEPWQRDRLYGEIRRRLSLKAVRLGPWRVQWCPIGRHVDLVHPVRDADLTDTERQFALSHHDVMVP